MSVSSGTVHGSLRAPSPLAPRKISLSGRKPSSCAGNWGTGQSTGRTSGPALPAWLFFSVGGLEVHRAVSSASYSPVATDGQPDKHRIAGPIRLRPAIRIPAALSSPTGCCETDPTDAATARSFRNGCAFPVHDQPSPGRLNELNRPTWHARLPETHLLRAETTDFRALGRGGCRTTTAVMTSAVGTTTSAKATGYRSIPTNAPTNER